MAYSDDLLEQSSHLSRRENIGKPKQASLRRAVSAAYYALFHLLTSDGAAVCAPASPPGLRLLVKRMFDHGKMREVCRRVHTGGSLGAQTTSLLSGAFSPTLRDVARTFVLIQEARHSADYDLSAVLSRADAQGIIAEAQLAITAWQSINGTDEANVFLAAMLHDRLGR